VEDYEAYILDWKVQPKCRVVGQLRLPVRSIIPYSVAQSTAHNHKIGKIWPCGAEFFCPPDGMPPPPPPERGGFHAKYAPTQAFQAILAENPDGYPYTP
jgi:hypothetical protein